MESEPESFTRRVNEFISELLEEYENIHAMTAVGFKCGNCEIFHLAVSGSNGKEWDIYGDERGYEVLEALHKWIDEKYKKKKCDSNSDYHE